MDFKIFKSGRNMSPSFPPAWLAISETALLYSIETTEARFEKLSNDQEPSVFHT